MEECFKIEHTVADGVWGLVCTVLKVINLFVFFPFCLGLHIQLARRVEERSLPPRHIINSYLTRTICVQAGELRHSETGGGGEQWRGRRRDLCSWLTKSFLFFFLHYPDKPQAWNPKRQKWRGSPSICHSLLHFFQTGFTHPPSEANPTPTLLLPRWMVSKTLCHCMHLNIYSLFGCCTRKKHWGFLTSCELTCKFEVGDVTASWCLQSSIKSQEVKLLKVRVNILCQF